MAERRMFHRLVVESDKFLDLSIGAQALYFHLGMQADDDGERWERRRWRKKRPERVAAVGKKRACFVRRRFCRAPQQERGAIIGR